MVSVNDSTKHFVLFFLGACIMLAGAGGFFALQDQDWHYTFDGTEEESPRHEGNVHYYGTLSAEQREIVDRAIDGEQVTFETAEPVPPAVVRKNDTYYVFDRFTAFDFGDLGTSAPVLVGLGGVAIMGAAARRDVRR